MDIQKMQVGKLLIQAIVYGEYEFAQRLIRENDIDPNAPLDHGHTPMMAAVSVDDPRFLHMLLPLWKSGEGGTGRDINQRDDRGSTALMYAAEEGKAWAVRTLLQHGADPNIRDYYGDSPLRVCLQGARPSARVVGMLLQYGALINSEKHTLSF